MSETRRTTLIEEPPEVEVVLRSLGRVVVRAGDRSAQRELAWRSRRPLTTNYRAFANATLAASLNPRQTPAGIDGLPERDRRKLMSAVVRLRDDEGRWRTLYGSPLSFDERFFAVMLWSWEGNRARLLARLRARHAERDRASARGIEPARSAAASLRSTSSILGADFAKSMTSAFMPMRSYDRLFGQSLHERLFGGLGVVDMFAGVHRPSLGIDGARKTTGKLSSALPTERGAPAGFASVLRPYTARPYSPLASSEMFRAGVSPSLADAVPPSFADQMAKSLPTLDWSYALRGTLGESLAASVLAGANGRLASAFAPGAFGAAAHASNLAQQVTALLHRPLFDGRTRLLFETGGLAALLPSIRMPAVDVMARFGDVLAPMRGLHEGLTGLAEFMSAWEDDPLWFLLSVFGMRAARRFVGLTREQVEQALLAALAEVVCDGEYVAALRQVLRDAPHLTRTQRGWLDHGLEHAVAGDWVQAVPQLLVGLEGALHRAAVGRALIVDRGGKFMAAETLVKKMAVDEEYTLFVVRRVFGGIGNAFRHGRADSGERDQVLFAVVALAGWVDFFLELNAMDVLASELSRRLDGAIERVADGLPRLPAT